MSKPHIGNLRRDFRIFVLYDSGQYAPKQIARMMEIGRSLVYEAIRRREKYRKFYEEHFHEFTRINQLDSD